MYCKVKFEAEEELEEKMLEEEQENTKKYKNIINTMKSLYL